VEFGVNDRWIDGNLRLQSPGRNPDPSVIHGREILVYSGQEKFHLFYRMLTDSQSGYTRLPGKRSSRKKKSAALSSRFQVLCPCHDKRGGRFEFQ